jgi:hypothetical protein
MGNAPILTPWAGGSFRSSERIVRELTDGTQAIREHEETMHRIAVLDAKIAFIRRSGVSRDVPLKLTRWEKEASRLFPSKYYPRE